MRVKVRVGHHGIDLRQVILRAGHVVHGDCIHELGRTVVLHVVRVAVTDGEPLVLDGSTLRFVVEGATLFLFLIVHVLV